MSDGLKLISAVLAAGSASLLLNLEPGMLIDNEQVAADFVRSHYRSYRELPSPQTLQEETGVRLPTIRESLQYYVDQVTERYEYNQIRDRFSGFRESLQQRDMEGVATSIATMSRVLRRRHSGVNAQSAMLLDEGMQQTYDRLLRIQGTGGVSGVMTGWDSYDRITGGYQDSDLITIVGRPSLGKTYLALYQAMQAHKAGHNVVFVTTEMGVEQIARRAAAIALGINPTLLKTGNISTHLLRRIQTYCQDFIGAERFRILSVGMNARVSVVDALCQEVGPSIVFIDGVYLLRPTDVGRNASRVERITGVFDEVKALTLDAGVPFVVTSQFNRQAGKSGKDGSLENIGYTDAVGTHSSIVVALKSGPTQNPAHSRVFDFLKGREGETGEVAINFKFAPLDMNEMSEEERQDEGVSTEESVAWMGMRRSAT